MRVIATASRAFETIVCAEETMRTIALRGRCRLV